MVAIWFVRERGPFVHMLDAGERAAAEEARQGGQGPDS